MKKCIAAVIFLIPFLVTLHAEAVTLDSSAAFTLRSMTGAGGPATGMDNTWGNGGYEGFITNVTDYHTDWTFVEFDLSAISGSVANATLDWVMYGSSTDTVYLNYYDGDGISSLDDWYTATTPYTSFDAGSSPYSIDIASLINDNLGSMDYLAFRWTIDVHPQQAFISMSEGPPVINYDPVPEPATMLLLGSGLIGLSGVRRRFKR